jgi:dedicator of cytokinesis protein 1
MCFFSKVEDFYQCIPNIQKLIFPYVPLPDDERNDLYVTLVTGNFDKGKKITEKNVEVEATLCDNQYEVIEYLNEVDPGYAVNGYKSLIYYHEAKPKWNEVFKVNH